MMISIIVKMDIIVIDIMMIIIICVGIFVERNIERNLIIWFGKRILDFNVGVIE